MTLSFIFLKVRTGFVEKVIQKLNNIPEVKESHAVTGGIDVIVKIEAETIEIISKVILKQIHEIDGVERTATHIAIPL